MGRGGHWSEISILMIRYSGIKSEHRVTQSNVRHKRGHNDEEHEGSVSLCPCKKLAYITKFSCLDLREENHKIGALLYVRHLGYRVA